MYAKAHPIGYIKQRNLTKKEATYGKQVIRVQTVTMSNGQTKNIYHTEPSYKRGRTLGDMVYESFK